VDLTSELLKNGWAKLKEIKREPSEEDNRRKDIESEAKAAGKGVWNPHGPKVRCSRSKIYLLLIALLQARTVNHTMPTDSQAFVSEWKGKPIDGEI